MVLETERLRLRKLAESDAAFILRLLNEPSFLRFIGDRGVRTPEDARAYILKGPVESYQHHGFGLLLAERKVDGAPAGMCGLLKRDTLPDPDIGFAFVPEFWAQGYAYESAAAVMQWGRNVAGLKRIVAIVSPDNERSVKLLQRLGMQFESMIRMAPETEEIKLFAWNAGENT